MSDETQYLDLLNEILERGCDRPDRTGIGTRAVFGRMMRFDLRGGTLPLFTTKRVFARGVVEELLWLIRGSTDSKELSDRGVKIWDANGSREFLDLRGLTHHVEGDLGPVYGFQWRHFGASYRGKEVSYDGEGVDQLRQVVHAIRTNPNGRRIILSAWNPADLHQMAIPPCHMFAQFFVDTTRGELSCQMHQRSADMGLGVPFNVASYALLTHMIAHVCGLKACEFIHVLGDAHIYASHQNPIRIQLRRQPRPFPTLKFGRDVNELDDFHPGDFDITGYHPHPPIKMDMAL